jgi:hypothetical protein
LSCIARSRTLGESTKGRAVVLAAVARPSRAFLYIATKSCPRGRNWPYLRDSGCAGGDQAMSPLGPIGNIRDIFDQLVGPHQERGGTSTPIALAVLRLIASSNFVGGLITTEVADSSRSL